MKITIKNKGCKIVSGYMPQLVCMDKKRKAFKEIKTRCVDDSIKLGKTLMGRGIVGWGLGLK